MVKALTGQILLQITNILLFLLLFCCFLVPTIYKQHIIPHLFCFLKAWSFRKWKKHFSYDSWRSALFYRLIPHKFIIQCHGLSGELEWRDSWLNVYLVHLMFHMNISTDLISSQFCIYHCIYLTSYMIKLRLRRVEKLFRLIQIISSGTGIWTQAVQIESLCFAGSPSHSFSLWLKLWAWRYLKWSHSLSPRI